MYRNRLAYWTPIFALQLPRAWERSGAENDEHPTARGKETGRQPGGQKRETPDGAVPVTQTCVWVRHAEPRHAMLHG